MRHTKFWGGFGVPEQARPKREILLVWETWARHLLPLPGLVFVGKKQSGSFQANLISANNDSCTFFHWTQVHNISLCYRNYWSFMPKYFEYIPAYIYGLRVFNFWYKRLIRKKTLLFSKHVLKTNIQVNICISRSACKAAYIWFNMYAVYEQTAASESCWVPWIKQ